MIIEREESWGKLAYDTSRHRFSYNQTDTKDAIPYPKDPVVLNVYLTMKCNMNCSYCVSKDFGPKKDLIVSTELINWINEQRFMVLVVTGGEPLLPEYESQLLKILRETQKKGLIVDTNGTILPSRSVIDTILDTDTLLRVSWDSPHIRDETYFRHMKPNTIRNRDVNKEYYFKKTEMIKRLCSENINVAVQSVVQKKNFGSIVNMPPHLKKHSIKQWYIQRFIPSHKAASKNFEVSNAEYDKVVAELIKRCRDTNIECIAKCERRHNCVLMLVEDGVLYTQGQKPRQKIELGTINSEIRYFDYMSSADHAERYYS